MKFSEHLHGEDAMVQIHPCLPTNCSKTFYAKVFQDDEVIHAINEGRETPTNM